MRTGGPLLVMEAKGLRLSQPEAVKAATASAFMYHVPHVCKIPGLHQQSGRLFIA